MPYYRRRERRMEYEIWTSAVRHELSRVRAGHGLANDARIPDAVLLAEAEHHFPPPNIWPVGQWFEARLAGDADTADQRDVLAVFLRSRRTCRTPWGVGSLGRRSRRTPSAA